MLEKITKDLEGKNVFLTQADYMITLTTSAEQAKEIIIYLKNLRFNLLTDLSAVDYPEKPERFEMIYNLLNIYDNLRIL